MSAIVWPTTTESAAASASNAVTPIVSENSDNPQRPTNLPSITPNTILASADTEMVEVKSTQVLPSLKKDPIKPCTIRILRDREIDQRIRKKYKKNEARSYIFFSALFLK